MFERGQVSLIDFMFALMIFLFVFATLHTVWTQNVTNLQKMSASTELQFKATQAVDSLTETSGFPEDWEESPEDVNILGLVKFKGTIHEEKLDAFEAMDYNLTKSLLKIRAFDYYFVFDSSYDVYDFNKGIEIPAEKTIVTLRRVMMYRGADCVVKLSLFR